MRIYRVMQAQNEKTKMKKEDAHNNLTDLRKKSSKAHGLTDSEKIHIDEQREYLSKLREEDDIIYYNGKPIEMNEAVALVLKYQKLLKVIERSDKSVRKYLSSIASCASSLFLFPLRKSLKVRIQQTDNKKTKKTLSKSLKFINSIPDSIKETILNSADVNLNVHIPKEK